MKIIKKTNTGMITTDTLIWDFMKNEELQWWIEEKALELNNEILLEQHRGSYFNMAKDFIYSLVEEIRGKQSE